MTRRIATNPDAAEHPFMQLWIDDNQQELEDWNNSFPETIPAGFEAFTRRFRLNGCRVVEIGVRRIGTKVSKPVDTFEGMTIADLQTKAGIAGVKYDKDTTKTDLIGRLRQKGVTK